MYGIKNRNLIENKNSILYILKDKKWNKMGFVAGTISDRD